MLELSNNVNVKCLAVASLLGQVCKHRSYGVQVDLAYVRYESLG